MENQSNAKTIAYIVLAVIIVAVLVLFVTGGMKTEAPGTELPANNTEPLAPDPAVIATQKAEILGLVESGKVLTSEQKLMIFELLNGERINYYGFTDEEKNAIVEALNKE